jgi:PTH1 family peptidyl-tRNA hydrolase
MRWWKGLVGRIRGLAAPSKRHAQQVKAVVLGIGNPGAEYRDTRHNVGFRVVERVVARMREVRRFRACHADIVVGEVGGGTRIACARPDTYVNRSGRAAKSLIEYFDIEASRLLVVVDDFNLALGRLRFRRGGSDGGHNGLKSIIEAIGKEFPRVRVGIGPVPEAEATIDFVLGELTEQEKEREEEATQRTAEAVAFYAEHGIEAVMGKFNS